MLDRLRTHAEWQLFGVLFRANAAMAVTWWALVVLRGLLPAAFAITMGWLVTSVEAGDSLGAPLATAGVLFVLVQAIGPFHDALSANLGATTSAWLHDHLLEACLAPPGLGHLESPALADELSGAREFDLGHSGPSLTASMPAIGGGFASFAGGAAQALVLAGYRWWAPVLVGGAWLGTHHFLKAGAIWRDRQSDWAMEQQRRAEYAYRLAVNAPGAKEVRLFGLGEWVVAGFRDIRRALLDESWERRRLAVRSVQVSVVLVLAANGLYFWSLAVDARAGDVGLGALVVYAQAAIGASALAFGEFDWWLRTAAQPVPLVLGVADRLAPAGALESGDAGSDGMPAVGVTFRDVHFAYPSTEIPVLEGVDLEVPAGRSLAIVGQNGAGKTTLTKLLCRMYDPDQGSVLVDGVDLRSLDVKAWRRRIAAVFQDFVRYEMTLADNVAPGGADRSDVTAALGGARAEGLAHLDTILSRAYDGGTDLSGGQWQRVALARALCAVRCGAGIVVLDEPTAHLDVRGEAEIFERLLDATRGCTTILISHRFSTVRRADRIAVVEGGRVVEQGTHDELMAERGRYHTMFTIQAARFAAGGAEDDLDHLDHLDDQAPVA